MQCSFLLTLTQESKFNVFVVQGIQSPLHQNSLKQRVKLRVAWGSHQDQCIGMMQYCVCTWVCTFSLCLNVEIRGQTTAGHLA